MRSVIVAAAACLWAGSAFAYDYVADVLVGNTVEVTNLATGRTSIYKLKADKSVERILDGQSAMGTWSVEDGKICGLYPGENNGLPQCSEVPRQPIAVPSERETELPNPTVGQPPVKLRIRYILGQ
jgi:hypothetical protein